MAKDYYGKTSNEAVDERRNLLRLIPLAPIDAADESIGKTMNYYEELGIHRDATTVEIRAAYKLAARLLHPDNQQERRLKDMAECQMKRLSGVVAVLLNPQERTRYDEGLADGAKLGRLAPLAPFRGPQILQTVLRQWFWVLMGSMTIVMAVWYGLAPNLDAPPGSVAESATVPTAPVVAHRKPAKIMKPRLKLAETRDARNAELPLRNTLGEEPVSLSSATAPTQAERPTVAAKEEQTGVAPMQTTELPEVEQSHSKSRFAGEWLYAADSREIDRAGTYPAMYVEFQLQEESGILVGHYRALHRIADKAISPEVVFRVRGESSAGNAGRFGWESSAGAKGELELTLRSPNQLQVKWWTTQFGRQEALRSGMAVLMRRKTP